MSPEAIEALRRSEALHRSLIEQVRDYAIFRTDPNGLATTWNRGVERVIGFTEDEFIGLDTSRAIFTEEDIEIGVPQAEMEEAAQTGTANDNRWMRRKDGTRFYAMGMTTALRDEEGNLTGFTKVMQDRTMQHRQAEDLREKTEQLAEANRHKDRFLAMLSHELRNPLTSIRNAVDVLRFVEPVSDGAAKAVGAIDRQSQQLSRLVDDLLDVTRISLGKTSLTLEEIELNEFLLRVVEDDREPFARAGIELTVITAREPLRVCADRVRLAQIVGNLLDNAKKFTAEGGQVSVSTGLEDGMAVITVTDTGIGMTRMALDKIFEPFVQANAGVERRGGLGLGLALVRGLVEAHGGRIDAHSEGPGRGSRFVVRCPLWTAEKTPQSSGPVSECASALRRVLIIDDNADAVDTLGAALALRGHVLESARTGRQGVEAARAFRPDVVLCDLGLPDIDGCAVARALRADPLLASTHLIALTGHALPQDIDRAMKAGFDLHMSKPADLEELGRLIARAVGGGTERE